MEKEREREGERERVRGREAEKEMERKLRERRGRGRDKCTHLHTMTEVTLKGDVCDKRFDVACPHNRTLDTHTLPYSGKKENQTPTLHLKHDYTQTKMHTLSTNHKEEPLRSSVK